MFTPRPANVSVHTLTKRYGTVEALRKVSFDVAAGEIFGLLGPNGAGKTTTIECILGLRRPDTGTVSIDGIDALSYPEQARQRTGAHVQSASLQDKITPRQALKLFSSFYRHPARVPDLLARFGLAEKADSAFETLSSGQRQRIFLALAFVGNPTLVVLDEPTAGLDPRARRELHQSIRDMRTDGKTVLLSTHYLEEAHELCDRVAILHEGRVIAMDEPDALIAAVGGGTGGRRPSLEDVFIRLTGRSWPAPPSPEA
jgi:ABC-2 type transport system ATP-binding protein